MYLMPYHRLFALATFALVGANAGANAQSVSTAPPSKASATSTVTTIVTTGDSVATAPANAVAAASVDASAIKIVELQPEQGKLANLLKAEAARAVASGLTPFVELGGVTCSRCQQLKTHFHEKGMIDAFKGTYIISLDAEHWTRQEEWKGDLYKVLGINDEVAIEMPAFYALDKSGMVPLDSAGVIPLDESGKSSTGQLITADDIPVGDSAAGAKALKNFFSKNMRK
jgi:hypothetical protein